MEHPVAKWNCAAAMFRYFGVFACDFYYPFFFLRCYPDKSETFAVIFGLIVLICGFTAGISGGIICDNFWLQNRMTKAWVCFIGNFIALPLFLISVLTTDNFWLCMVMVALKYLSGEVWKSPNLTMMQDTVDPQKFGNYVAAYQFFYVMSGCFSLITFGWISNTLEIQDDHVAIGRLLGVFCTVAYTGACFSFYMGGRNYQKYNNI